MLLLMMMMMTLSLLLLYLCRKKQLLSDDRARRVTSNDSIKIFTSASDKPENIGRAVLSYSPLATTTQVQYMCILGQFTLQGYGVKASCGLLGSGVSASCTAGYRLILV